MSVEAMSWALSQQIVSDPTARHVLLCLANYADVNGMAAFPSVERLKKVTGLSERTIRYKLDDLERAGAIRRGNQAVPRAYIGRDDKCPVAYDICIERGADCARGANGDTTGCKLQQDGVQITTERGAPAAPNPSYNHPPTTQENFSLVPDDPPAEPEADPVEVIFEHWRTTMESPRSRLDDRRTKTINAALKIGYSVAELCKAINGCKKSPYHMGKNDRQTKYNGLDLILRNAEYIDRFIRFDDEPPAGAEPPRGNGRPSMNSFDQSQPDEYDDFFNHRRGFDR
jgi:hypothetical protein